MYLVFCTPAEYSINRRYRIIYWFHLDAVLQDGGRVGVSCSPWRYQDCPTAWCAYPTVLTAWTYDEKANITYITVLYQLHGPMTRKQTSPTLQYCTNCMDLWRESKHHLHYSTVPAAWTYDEKANITYFTVIFIECFTTTFLHTHSWLIHHNTMKQFNHIAF